jgi:hypothetical protein
MVEVPFFWEEQPVVIASPALFSGTKQSLDFQQIASLRNARNDDTKLPETSITIK